MARSRLIAVSCLALLASVGCARPEAGGSRSASFSPGSLFGGPPSQKEPGIVEREPDDVRQASAEEEATDDENSPARRPTRSGSRARRDPTADEEASLTAGADRGNPSRSPKSRATKSDAPRDAAGRDGAVRTADVRDEADRRRESDELFDEVFAELGVDRPARTGTAAGATRPAKSPEKTPAKKSSTARRTTDEVDFEDEPPRRSTRSR
jgi:hypothetical protein